MKGLGLLALLLVVGCCGELAIGAAIPLEANSLAALKQATAGNGGALENWVGSDPCGDKWIGVLCSPDSPSHVIQLELPGAGLSGTLPAAIGQLSQLQVLNLSSNSLLGPVPNELGSLTQLQVLDLHSNQLMSTLGPWLAAMTQLTTLDLSSNLIWGDFPITVNWGQLSSLQTLNLSSNSLGGPILPGMGALQNLRTLDLSQNRLTGSIPPELSNLTNLNSLFLQNNNLTGTIPSALTQEPQLIARYDGNPLCDDPLNTPYCTANPTAPLAMAPLSGPLLNAASGSNNSGRQLATNGTCLVGSPCTCANGKEGKTRCGNTAADVTCDCGRGFHWSKTDTIITICVCLSFGMLAKTVCLVLYLRRRYLKKARADAFMISDPHKSSPVGPDPLMGSGFGAGGGAYQPMAGTPSQTSSESFENQETKPLHVAIDLDNQKWQRGTIGDTLKRNAQLAAISDISSEEGEQHHQSTTPSDASLTPRGFKLEGLSGRVPLLFTFKELQNATQNFSPTLLVGEGGFGRVYYGVLDTREVAVKRLEKTTALPGKHGEKQFRVEVDMMSRLKHPNLLEFIGYCADKGERALVYPLMVNQSLFRRLHERPAQTAPLDCLQRVTIAHQAARALAYLHDDVTPQVIHRDFNSSNVLLNENLDAVVSDFGLAKLVSDETGQTQTTKLFGTMGYMAPEYLHGHVTDKNDVYSFGVVLLELISGRRAVIAKDLDVVQWARGFVKSGVAPVDMLADPLLQGTWPEGALQWCVELAMACVDFEPLNRPKMADVASALAAVLQEMKKLQPAAVSGDQLTSPNAPVTSANSSSSQSFPPNFSVTEFLGSLKKE